MSIQRAEVLKREWTDKYVMVQNGVPELRRFDGLVGQVKTVNMNCRLLVEFDAPADISWYDIDPQFVQVVDPEKVKKAAKEESSKAEAAPIASKSSTGTASASSDGGSPLDKIRQQAAGGAKAKTPTAGGSPLDQIRAQGAGGGKAEAGAVESVAAAPASGSPLDQIRAQAAGGAKPPKGSGSAETASKTAASNSGSPLDQIRAQAAGGANAPDESAKTESSSGTAPVGGSPLDQIRAQAAGSAGVASTGTSGVANPATGTATSTSAVTSSKTSGGGSSTAGDSGHSPTDGDTDTTDSRQSNTSGMSPLDQIRAQAAADSPDYGGGDSGASGNQMQTTLFDQVKDQAAENASDDSSSQDIIGIEDPVKVTFHGRKLPKQDDLKIVEGIGPKIEELFHADGIMTWEQLSKTDPERLRTILHDAGPRFRMHNPDTWPKQAELAFSGKWPELEKYQDELDGGRPPE